MLGPDDDPSRDARGVSDDANVATQEHPHVPAQKGAIDAPALPAAELFSKTVQIEFKRIYLDLKENQRGRYLKIAELDAVGNKSTLTLPISCIPSFRDVLDTMAKLEEGISSLPPVAEADMSSRMPPIRSESMQAESKRIYFDLRANQRGRFLRISQASTYRAREAIVVPSTGIPMLRDAIDEVVNKAGESVGDAAVLGSTVGSREFRADGKRIFTDVGTNPRGTFLRISEMSGTHRASVTVPLDGWAELRSIIDDSIAAVAATAHDVSPDGRRDDASEKVKKTENSALHAVEGSAEE